jgi:cobalt/nickel transport system permease protein
LTYGAAAVGLAAGAAALRSARPTREKLQLAVGLGCVVFAAQAINVPIAPGISAHLVGGVLLAWLLGPGLAAWTMAVVLTAQALLLGDGGIAALGANVLNMAILPAGIVATMRRLESVTERMIAPRLSLGLAAGVAVLLAAALIVLETALFRPLAEPSGWANFAALMLGTHAWIGILEGGLTTVLVAALVPLASPAAARSVWRPALLAVAAGLLLAALLLPISSSLPDGYEAAAQASGMSWLLAP